MPVPSGSSSPTVRRLLRDQARDAIRDAILRGDFQPGEQLDDAELQKWLGVSRSPIRNALIQLQEERLVVIAAQSKTRVFSPDIEDVEEGMQTLGSLVGGVVRVVVPLLTKQWREEFIALIERAVAAVQLRDPNAHLSAGREFHEELFRACPNSTLAALAGRTSTTVLFHLQATLDRRTPNWSLLESSWLRTRRGFELGDNVLAQLALEEQFRLPSSERSWAPANWD
ncbi:DNA-binding GntR family transcriptional regulator [Leucobacter luti]|nr:DNA-binding GntR family transcriptional regulator [Leucobacter luti]